MTLNHDYWITLGYFKQIRKIMIGIVMSHNSNMITVVLWVCRAIISQVH